MRLLIALLVALGHAAIILLALYHPEGEQPKPKKPASVYLLKDVELEEKREQTGDPNALHVHCPNTYEGIGIKRRWGGMVTQVAKGWPADRAGIRPGDIIEPWLFDPVDGFMEFEVVRGSQRVKMRLRTEKICFRDNPF